VNANRVQSEMQKALPVVTVDHAKILI
jgi:hypothetical protein